MMDIDEMPEADATHECEEQHEDNAPDAGFDISVELRDGEWWLSFTGRRWVDEVSITFCPFCGERLRV